MEDSLNAGAGGAPKLPYFHRKLSQEETDLIGDITPKPIAAPQVNAVFDATATATNSTKSAWNAADTWEEKNCTDWAKELFATAVLATECPILETTTNACSYTLTINATACGKSVSGNANVTHVRGTARFMYEFAFDGVKFTLDIVTPADSSSSSSSSSSSGGGKVSFQGSVNVADVINDQFDDIDLQIKDMKLTGKKTVENINKITAEARKVLLSKTMFRAYLRKVVDRFEANFRETYNKKQQQKAQ